MIKEINKTKRKTITLLSKLSSNFHQIDIDELMHLFSNIKSFVMVYNYINSIYYERKKEIKNVDDLNIFAFALENLTIDKINDESYNKMLEVLYKSLDRVFVCCSNISTNMSVDQYV